MSRSDEIRAFALQHIVQPGRRAGRLVIEVRAGDVSRMMRLMNRTPLICSALDASEFASQASAIRIVRSGPRFGSNARWELTLRPSSTRERLAEHVVTSLGNDQSPPPAAPAARVSPGEFLDDARRRVIGILRIFGPMSGERVTVGEQVRRLVEAKRIPFVTGRLIQCLLAARNGVIYDNRSLTDIEFAQVRAIAGIVEAWGDSMTAAA